MMKHFEMLTQKHMFEEKLDNAKALPPFYRRYADDTLTIVKDENAAIEFCDTLNKCHASVNFTYETATNKSISFCGVTVTSLNGKLATEVYHKPTDTGLLLHFRSHVDNKYKKCLVKTMLFRAYKLSSNWHNFHKETEHLRTTFANLAYPIALFDVMLSEFLDRMNARTSGDSDSDNDTTTPTVRFVIPFKDCKSAQNVKRQFAELSSRVFVRVQPVFTSKKVAASFVAKEKKPDLVNQQCVVYRFQCGQCDAGYVGITTRHLHQRIEEHRLLSSSIGKHLVIHPTNELASCFSLLRKCRNRWECLVHESIFIAYFRIHLKNGGRRNSKLAPFGVKFANFYEFFTF